MQAAGPLLHLGGDPEAQPEDGQVAGDRAEGVQCHPVGAQAPRRPAGHRPLRRRGCHGKGRGRSGLRHIPAGTRPYIAPHTGDTRVRSASPAGQHLAERSGEAPLRGFVCVPAVPGVGDSWAEGLPLLRARLWACQGARIGRVKTRPPFHCRSVAEVSRTRRRSAFPRREFPRELCYRFLQKRGKKKKSLLLLQLAGLFQTPLLFQQLKNKGGGWNKLVQRLLPAFSP